MKIELMISKKLLSKILNLNIFNVEKISTESNLHYGYYTENHQERSGEINIYELAHLCKEWAKRTGFMIESDNSNESRVYPTDENGWVLKKEIDFFANSEPEAIFQACGWILINMSKSEIKNLNLNIFEPSKRIKK